MKSFWRLVAFGLKWPLWATTSINTFHVRVWSTSPRARAMSSRSVFGTAVEGSVVWFAMTLAKSALFLSGPALISVTRLFARELATGEDSGTGVGDPGEPERGVYSF